MLPSEELLTIEDVAADRRRRHSLWAVLGGTAIVASALFSILQGAWALPLTASVVVGGVVLAGRYELPGRALAIVRVTHLRRAGAVATEKLVRGDIAAAQADFVALLPQAKSLQAFHATHVLMYGVTRFLEGDTTEGLRLADRALKSGWFDVPQMRALSEAAVTWTALMLISARRLGDARVLIDTRRALATAHVMLATAEERFAEAIAGAHAALNAPRLPSLRSSHRRHRRPLRGAPAECATGHHRVRGCARRDAAGPLALKNPAVAPFLPAAFRLTR